MAILHVDLTIACQCSVPYRAITCLASNSYQFWYLIVCQHVYNSHSRLAGDCKRGIGDSVSVAFWVVVSSKSSIYQCWQHVSQARLALQYVRPRLLSQRQNNGCVDWQVPDIAAMA